MTLQISFSASGRPAEAANSILQQSKTLRAQNPGAEALIVTVRDQIVREIHQAPEDATVSVSASVMISLTATPIVKPAEPAPLNNAIKQAMQISVPAPAAALSENTK